MKLLVFSVCLAFLSVVTAVDVSARPPCGKVHVEGHYDKHGKWIKPHWIHQHWVPGHNDRHHHWIEGHCA